MEQPFPHEFDTSHGHGQSLTRKPFDSSPNDGKSPDTEQTLSAEKPANPKNIVDLTNIENDKPLHITEDPPAERDANKSFSYGPPVTVVPNQFTARSPGRPATPTGLHQEHVQAPPQAHLPKLPTIGGKPGLTRFSGRNRRNRVIPNPLDARRASPIQNFRPFLDDGTHHSNEAAVCETKQPSPRPPFQPQPFPDPPSPRAATAHVTHPQPAYVEKAMSTGFDAEPSVLGITSPVKLSALATSSGYHNEDYGFENNHEYYAETSQQHMPQHHPLPSDFAISSPQVTPQVKRTSIHPLAPKHTTGDSRSSRGSRGHRHSIDRSSHRHRVQAPTRPFRKPASENRSGESMRKVRAQSHSSNISRRRDAPDAKKAQQQHLHRPEKLSAKSVTSSPELKQHTVRVRHKFASNMAEVLNEFNIDQETALQKQRERYREKVKSLKLELERVAEESSALAARSNEKSNEIQALQASESEKNARIVELEAKLENFEQQNTSLVEKLAAFKSRCSSIIEEQRALYTDTKSRCEETITEVRTIAATRISEAEVVAKKAENVRKALMERVHQDIAQNKRESSELYERIRALTQQVEEKDHQITRDQDTIRGLSTRIQDIQASSERFEKLAVKNEGVLCNLGELITKECARHDESAKETNEWLDSISCQLEKVSQTVAAQPGLTASLGETQEKSLSDIKAKLEVMLASRESASVATTQLATCIETHVSKVLQRLNGQFEAMTGQLALKVEEKAILSTLLEEKKTRCEALDQEIVALKQTSTEQTERINALQQNISAMETQHNNDQEEIQRLQDVGSQLEQEKEMINDDVDSKAATIRELEDKLRSKEEAYSTEVRTFGIEVSKLNQALREQESSNQITVKQAAEAARNQVKVEMDRIISDTRRMLQQTEKQRDTLAGEIKVLKGTIQEKESRLQTVVRNAVETARSETRIEMERAMSADQKLLSETQKHRDNLITEVKKLDERLRESQQAAQEALHEASDSARRETRDEMGRDVAEMTRYLEEAQQHLEHAIQEKRQEKERSLHLVDSLKKTLAAEEAAKKNVIQESTERLAEYNQQIEDLKARVTSLEAERDASRKTVAELESERDQQRARCEALAAGLIDWAGQSGIATESIRDQFEHGKAEEIKACVLHTLAQLALSQRLKALNAAPSLDHSQQSQNSLGQAANSHQRRPQDGKETAIMDDSATFLGSPGSLTGESPGTLLGDASATPVSSPSNDPGSQRRRVIIRTPMSEPDPVPPTVDQEKIRRREALQPKSVLRRVTRSASSGRLSQENIDGVIEPGTSPDPLGIQNIVPNSATPTRPKLAAAVVRPAVKRGAKRKAPASTGNRATRNKTTPTTAPDEHPISALGGSRTLSLEPESPGQPPKSTGPQQGKSPLGTTGQINTPAPGGPQGPSPEKRTPLPNSAASWTASQLQPVSAGDYGTRRRRRSLSPAFETDASGLPILRSQPRFWSRPQVPLTASQPQEPRASGDTGGYQDSIIDPQEVDGA
ncbi:hypothetical protein QBC41DRAFT_322741 [Cercophora samala]|uniref:Uncharacterized protein n=1 Tax=Cercophora samala TaxID=330535 RepID=A0AA40DAJ7_9PEZI|nr:hypothetical protein QBC41DRAFT_322741 [Cercophora samala]